MIYLDNAATTKPYNDIVGLLKLYSTDIYYNATSKNYAKAEATNGKIEEFREEIRKALNADKIIFTSGATESNNLVFKGLILKYLFNSQYVPHIVTTEIEHPSILNTCEALSRLYGVEVSYIAPDKNGFINPDDVSKAIKETTTLVSVHKVNNEIGTIQNLKAISKFCAAMGVPFHSDAAQSFGKVPLDFNYDYLTISGHKIHGVKGIGVLALGRKAKELEPMMYGGGQENDVRSGTLPTHQIAAMAYAVSRANDLLADTQHRQSKLKQQLWDGIKDIKGIKMNAVLEGTSPSILSVSFLKDYVKELSDKGLMVSAGSACSCDESAVMKAIGSENPVRMSLGVFTTKTDIKEAIKIIREVCQG